ncbi:MAG: hypothetical protein A4S09_15260 [Proteobacteria bacterium SG_bin7]|nr:MAG: hypothetical protein A4S09_15260 [Proteobacteria bacterium SG_bin7]
MTLQFLFILSFFFSPITQAATSESLTQSNLNPNVDWPKPVDDSENFGLTLLERLEYESGQDSSVNWDLIAWRGGDFNRVWIKSEGSYSLVKRNRGQTDFQLLYGKLVSAFFDAQIGARIEQAWGDQNSTRVSGVLGLQGLSLYFFELEAALFLGGSSGVSARITGTKDFLFTQKTILQFRAESSASATKSEEFETGAGINDLSLSLRLRYELKRELAPYIGVNSTTLYGETQDFGRRGGGENAGWSAIAGLRAWY